MNTRDREEREWELHKQLDELDRQQEECDILQKDIDDFEEESYWQNRQIKAVNDDLFDSYPQDTKLQELLAEKEELLQQKMSIEKSFFQECRDLIKEHRQKAELQKEDYKVELQMIQRKKGEEADEDNIYTDTAG